MSMAYTVREENFNDNVDAYFQINIDWLLTVLYERYRLR